MYEYRNVNGHIEVFKNDIFCFSADTMEEARREARELDERRIPANLWKIV